MQDNKKRVDIGKQKDEAENIISLFLPADGESFDFIAGNTASVKLHQFRAFI